MTDACCLKGNEDKMVPGFGHGTWIGKGSNALNDTPEMLHERVTFHLYLLCSHA